MKFVDHLYEFYKERLEGSEENAVALVLYTLQEHSRQDLMRLIDEMSDEEVYHMVGQYLIEQLKIENRPRKDIAAQSSFRQSFWESPLSHILKMRSVVYADAARTEE